ncbi:MAG: carbohydrate ABC transporter permease [Acidimicrobiales bacterium]|jgi:multiple sugar transport system permease protein
MVQTTVQPITGAGSVDAVPRTGRTRRPMSPRRTAVRLVWYIIMLGFTAFFIVPVIWLLIAPTKTDHQLVYWGPMAFGSFHTFLRTWDEIYSFQGHELLTWLGNSAEYSVGGLVLALLSAVVAGYGLALTEFIGRRMLLSITLIVMIMPASALVLPLFLEMNLLHLLGSAWSVILPFGFFPFGVYLSYIFFSSTIPRDLLAAARVDGASEWAVFRLVALPLARPIVALVGFFAFVSSWTNFFLPFVMFYSDRQYPLPVGLEYLVSSTSAFNPVVGANSPVLRPELAMATLVAIAPVFIVFFFAQRSLVTGMLAGSTKE